MIKKKKTTTVIKIIIMDRYNNRQPSCMQKMSNGIYFTRVQKKKKTETNYKHILFKLCKCEVCKMTVEKPLIAATRQFPPPPPKKLDGGPHIVAVMTALSLTVCGEKTILQTYNRIGMLFVPTSYMIVELTFL